MSLVLFFHACKKVMVLRTCTQHILPQNDGIAAYVSRCQQQNDISAQAAYVTENNGFGCSTNMCIICMYLCCSTNMCIISLYARVCISICIICFHLYRTALYLCIYIKRDLTKVSVSETWSVAICLISVNYGQFWSFFSRELSVCLFDAR